MKKYPQKLVLLLLVSFFMTSCFSTKQSCGFAQTKQSIKKVPAQTLYADVVILKAE